MTMMHEWPTCGKCKKRITVHYLIGQKAWCDAGKNVAGDFTVREVNDCRRAVGMKVSNAAMQKEISAGLAEGKT